jgi:hypothetical protein
MDGRTAGAALLVACVLGACGADSAEQGADELQLEPQRQCIFGGTEHDQVLGLSAAEENAVAHLSLHAQNAQGSSGATCSGLWIAPRFVLSAAHCVPRGASDVQVDVRFGASAACGGPVMSPLRAQRVHAHPTLDALLVELATDPRELGLTLEPVRWSSDVPELGELVVIAGFGWTESDSPGTLRFAAESVERVAAPFVDVRGENGSGACLADSGGPLFGRDAHGELVSYGLLSEGSADCQGTDRYVLTSELDAWLRSFM